ncbi:hypothetical protein PanWU01x14_135440 [Parasponia andersonii]|uniref:Uncharacterized protein n=1 Tax=Parasponia andersonii TaxID=3476 RepID=A0A2P5CPB9_PARAD|nr:hypothetical protein PanWU01x14_135440 [Parasponia andersonii]
MLQYLEEDDSSPEEFMVGKYEANPGELPTISDWENHLGMLYTEVSLKRYLEMRGADCRCRVPRSGLETPFPDGLLRHVAPDVVKRAKGIYLSLVRDELERRGFTESRYIYKYILMKSALLCAKALKYSCVIHNETDGLVLLSP